MAHRPLLSTFAATAFVGALSLAACAKQTPEPASSANAPMPSTSTVSADEAMQPASPPASVTDNVGSTAADPQASAQPAPLTDGQILKVVATVDQGEIDQAKEAQKKSKNAQVKKLAGHLLQQHTKSKAKGAALAKKAKLTPEESPVCSELSSKGEAVVQSIKAAPAPLDAERAYVDAQVEQHAKVLDLINTRLMPSATNPELKAQLEETRTMVEEHLGEAKKLQEALAAAPAS